MDIRAVEEKQKGSEISSPPVTFYPASCFGSYAFDFASASTTDFFGETM